MEQTSIDVYHEIVNEGLVGKIQARILRELAFSYEPMTMGEIAKAIGISQRNTVDPRGPELRKRGVISVAGQRKCKITGRTVNAYSFTGKRPSVQERQETKDQIINRLSAQIEKLEKEAYRSKLTIGAEPCSSPDCPFRKP